MSVEVRWFVTLIPRTRSRAAVTTVPWRADLTPLSILLDEGFRETDADAVMPVVGDEQVDLTTTLADGVSLKFIVSISGGASRR